LARAADRLRRHVHGRHRRGLVGAGWDMDAAGQLAGRQPDLCGRRRGRVEVGPSAWGGDVSVGDDMFKGGIVVPKVIGWGAALVGLTLVAGGVDLYYDLRGRVDRLSDRMAAVEEAGPSQTQALNAIRDEMARTSNE